MFELKSQIQTDRLDLNIYEPSFKHANELFLFLQNNKGCSTLLHGIEEPYSPEAISNFLLQQSLSWGSYLYAINIKHSERMIGFIAIHSYHLMNNNVQLSLFLNHAEENGGLMVEALAATVETLFAASCHKIKAYVDPTDQIGRSIYEECGFKLEAILKEEKYNSQSHQYVDMLLYSLINKKHP